MVWIRQAIRGGIASALPHHVDRLEQIGRTADDVVEQLGALDRWLRAENRTGYRLSVVQTLFGTLIGLLAGFGNDWIAEGGAGRIGIALAVGLALVAVGPPLTVRLFVMFEKRLSQT
jgi:hypothetical protein